MLDARAGKARYEGTAGRLSIVFRPVPGEKLQAWRRACKTEKKRKTTCSAFQIRIRMKLVVGLSDACVFATCRLKCDLLGASRTIAKGFAIDRESTIHVRRQFGRQKGCGGFVR